MREHANLKAIESEPRPKSVLALGSGVGQGPLRQNRRLTDRPDYHSNKSRFLTRARISRARVNRAIRLVKHFTLMQHARFASLYMQLDGSIQNVSEHRTGVVVRAGLHARRQRHHLEEHLRVLEIANRLLRERIYL
jgi:hypothetical protein